MAAMPTSPSYSVLGGRAPLTPTIPCEWTSTPLLSPTDVVLTEEAEFPEGYSEHPEAASSAKAKSGGKNTRNRAGRKKANRSDASKQQIKDNMNEARIDKRKALCIKTFGYWEKNMKISKRIEEKADAIKQDMTDIKEGSNISRMSLRHCPRRLPARL